MPETIQIENQIYEIKTYKNPEKKINTHYLKLLTEYKQSSGMFKLKTIESDNCDELYAVTLYHGKDRQVYFVKLKNGSYSVEKKYRSYETERKNDETK